MFTIMSKQTTTTDSNLSKPKTKDPKTSNFDWFQNFSITKTSSHQLEPIGSQILKFFKLYLKDFI